MSAIPRPHPRGSPRLPRIAGLVTFTAARHELCSLQSFILFRVLSLPCRSATSGGTATHEPARFVNANWHGAKSMTNASRGSGDFDDVVARMYHLPHHATSEVGVRAHHVHLRLRGGFRAIRWSQIHPPIQKPSPCPAANRTRQARVSGCRPDAVWDRARLHGATPATQEDPACPPEPVATVHETCCTTPRRGDGPQASLRGG